MPDISFEEAVKKLGVAQAILLFEGQIESGFFDQFEYSQLTEACDGILRTRDSEDGTYQKVLEELCVKAPDTRSLCNALCCCPDGSPLKSRFGPKILEKVEDAEGLSTAWETARRLNITDSLQGAVRGKLQEISRDASTVEDFKGFLEQLPEDIPGADDLIRRMLLKADTIKELSWVRDMVSRFGLKEVFGEQVKTAIERSLATDDSFEGLMMVAESAREDEDSELAKTIIQRMIGKATTPDQWKGLWEEIVEGDNENDEDLKGCIEKRLELLGDPFEDRLRIFSDALVDTPIETACLKGLLQKVTNLEDLKDVIEAAETSDQSDDCLTLIEEALEETPGLGDLEGDFDGWKKPWGALNDSEHALEIVLIKKMIANISTPDEWESLWKGASGYVEEITTAMAERAVEVELPLDVLLSVWNDTGDDDTAEAFFKAALARAKSFEEWQGVKDDIVEESDDEDWRVLAYKRLLEIDGSLEGFVKAAVNPPEGCDENFLTQFAKRVRELVSQESGHAE